MKLEIERKKILLKLNEQIKKNKHLIGVSCGSGIAAKQAAKGGADFILALNSGRFRQAGLSSLAGFLPFTNCNSFVMEYGTKEIIPRVKDIPVIFGLCATDPMIDLPRFLEKICSNGFSGINNYPTVGMIDGEFRRSLEEEGISYDKEVEAIGLAHKKDMFTIAFVFNREQAKKMIDAGADIICAHFGLTRGGILGAKKYLSLEAGVKIANEVFDECNRLRPNVLKAIYGGPVNSTVDVKYFYDNTDTQGYIGGSTFDRTPTEEFISSITMDFKLTGEAKTDSLFEKMLTGITKYYDYVSFIKEYVSENYMNKISFSELAQVVHVSRTHLSTLFKKEVGCTFPEYLTRYRINKAIELTKKSHLHWVDIAPMVGFVDYTYFSKVFKKHTGMSPREYMREYTVKDDAAPDGN